MLPSSLRATESPMNTDLISSLQSMRDRLGPMLAEKFGDAFDGDMDTLLDAINHLKRDTTQPPHQDRRLVDTLADWGFLWGGRFVVPDGNHFEYRRAPS